MKTIRPSNLGSAAIVALLALPAAALAQPAQTQWDQFAQVMR